MSEHIIDISAEKPSVRKEIESLCEKLSVSKNKKLKEKALSYAGVIMTLGDSEVHKTLGAW